MKRFEIVFASFCLACWAVSIVAVLDIVRITGNLPLTLYPLFSFAAALGWIVGNIYVQRARRLAGSARRRLWILYFFGPLGVIYMVQAMAPGDGVVRAPLVPLLSFCVFAALFLVPVTLSGGRPPRSRLRLDRED